MRRVNTSADPYQPSGALVTEGPFYLSRNPIYLAMTVMYIGAALVVGSLWLLMFLLPLLAVMHWGVIVPEERYLANKFGDAYAHYRSRVARWL